MKGFEFLPKKLTSRFFISIEYKINACIPTYVDLWELNKHTIESILKIKIICCT